MSEEVYDGEYYHLPPAEDRPKLALDDIDYHAGDDEDDEDDGDASDNEPDADSDTDNDGDGDGDDANDEDEADEVDAVADDNAYADICDATGEVDVQDTDDNTAEVPNTNIPLYGHSPNASTTDVPFRHNPLHDFESVVWLSFYLLLASVFKLSRKTPPEVASKYRTKQEVVFHKLFSERNMRIHIMNGGSQADHHFSELDPTVSAVAQLLLKMRTPLVNAFMRAEAEMTTERPIPFSMGKEAAAGMGTEILEIIAETLASKDLFISTEDKTRPRKPVAKQAATEDGQNLASSATPGQGGPEASSAQAGASLDPGQAATKSSRRQARPVPTSERTLRSHTRALEGIQAGGAVAGPSTAPSRSQPNTRSKTRTTGRATSTKTAAGRKVATKRTSQPAATRASGSKEPDPKATREMLDVDDSDGTAGAQKATAAGKKSSKSGDAATKTRQSRRTKN